VSGEINAAFLGETLDGRYRVVSRLAAGGMGAVYVALDDRVGHKVVVKVPHTKALVERSGLLRFRREILALSRLDHPHIVRVFDAGSHRGVPYLVMEFLSGGTLASRIAEAAQEHADVSWLPGIAKALDFIHRRRVFHRDVKPGNILFDWRETAYLADFGVVKATRALDVSVTAGGWGLGSAAYMAPEQIDGDNVSGAADQYALATILYEQFAGRLPFTGRFIVLLARKVREAPPSLAEFAPWLPRPVMAAVMRGLAADPVDRFGSCAELAEAVQEGLAVSETIPRRGGERRVRAARRRLKQSARRLTWAGLAAAAAVVLLALALWRLHGPGSDKGTAAAGPAARRDVEASRVPPIASEPPVGHAEDPAPGATTRPSRPERRPERAPAAARAPVPASAPRSEAVSAPAAPSTPEDRARALVRASREAERSDATLALLLARAAVRCADLPESEGRLRQLMSTPLQGTQLADHHRERITSAAFALAGGRVLTTSADRTARLWNSAGRFLIEFRGHAGAVNCAELSPRGDRILTASDDGTAREWSLDGKQTRVLRPGGGVHTASYAPDGARILTASSNGTVVLWSRDGEATTLLRAAARAVGAAMSPSGGGLLAWCRSGECHLWDARGRRVITFRAHAREVSSAAFSSSGNRFVTTSADGTARVWDTRGNKLATLRCGREVLAAAFSPDGERIVTAVVDGIARVWDRTGRETVRLEGHTGAIRTAAFSPTGDRIVTASSDSTARIWDGQGRVLAVLQGHQASVSSAEFGPTGDLVLTRSLDGTARLWSSRGERRAVFYDSYPSALSVRFSPAGSVVLAVVGDRRSMIWNLRGKLLAAFPSSSAVRFSPTGESLAVAHDSSLIEVHDAAGRRQWTLRGHTRAATGLEFAPAGEFLLSHTQDEAILWNLRAQTHGVVNSRSHRFVGARLSPSGKHVLLQLDDSTARLWDGDGRLVSDLGRVPVDWSRCSFDPSGEHVLLALARMDEFHLWSVAENKMERLRPYKEVTFSSFAPVMLAVETDGTVWLLSLTHQKSVVLTSSGRRNRVVRARFAPDGARILTQDSQGAVQLWTAQGTHVSDLDGERSSHGTIFSADGDRILLARSDTEGTAVRLSIWDREGRRQSGFRVAGASLSGVRLSGDPLAVLVASPGGTSRIHDDPGHVVARLTTAESYWGPRGLSSGWKWLLVGGRQEALRLCLVRRVDLLAAADRRLTRDLTAGERRKYAGILGRAKQADR